MQYFEHQDVPFIVLNLLNNDVMIKSGNKEFPGIKATDVKEGEEHFFKVRHIGGFVKLEIGNPLHPMLDVHYISFVLLKTKTGIQIHYLNPGEVPVIDFLIGREDEIIDVYAYCTVHGLFHLQF